MRRTVKNQKVMNIVALGLAAMLAFASMPMTAFAEDETIVEICENAEKEAVASEEKIDVAIEEVADVEPQTSEEPTEGSITADLADAQDFVEAAAQNLTVDTDETGATVAEELEIVVDKTDKADKIVAAVMDKDPQTDQNMVGSAIGQVGAAEAFLDDAKETITETADNAIAEAGVANSTNDREEAYAAADKAVQDVEKAEADLQDAVDEYNKADEELQKVQDELSAAKVLYDEADAALLNATQSLGNAEDNATKAAEKMAAAQAKIDALEKQANDLTELKEQYYDMMVWYFRNCSGGAAVYKNGELDVEASAKKISQDRIDANAKSIKTDLIPLTRYVTNLLVDYMLTGEGATDITFGQDGEANGYMQAGVLTKDSKNNDRVLLNGDDGAAEKTDINWHRTGNTADGRGNYVTVTYKDKNDADQEIRVNYVLKNSKYDENADIATGIFYLAEIRNENGEVIVDRIVNENNFDDYQKLCKAYEALSDLKEYEEASKAVAAAADEVAKFKAEIDKLQNITVDRAQLDLLQKKLDAAQETLDAAKIVKEGLEEYVAEARKIVDSIDLSRFAVVIVPAEEAAAEGEELFSEETLTIAGGEVNGITVEGAAVQAQPGVLGVKRPAAQGSGKKAEVLGVKREANDDGAVIAENVAQIEEIDEIREIREIESEEAVQEIITIEDEEVALAGTIEKDGAQMNWWWLLLLIVAALIAKKVYDDHRKEARA